MHNQETYNQYLEFLNRHGINPEGYIQNADGTLTDPQGEKVVLQDVVEQGGMFNPDLGALIVAFNYIVGISTNGQPNNTTGLQEVLYETLDHTAAQIAPVGLVNINCLEE